jgi:hypothetical protein
MPSETGSIFASAGTGEFQTLFGANKRSVVAGLGERGGVVWIVADGLRVIDKISQTSPAAVMASRATVPRRNDACRRNVCILRNYLPLIKPRLAHKHATIAPTRALVRSTTDTVKLAIPG